MLSEKGCLPKPQKIGDRFFFVKKELERCLGEDGRRVHREKKFKHPWELDKIQNKRLISKKERKVTDG